MGYQRRVHGGSPDGASFGLPVRALERRLVCRSSQRLRLTARSHVGRLGEDGPRLPRYRTPFEFARVVGCPTVQRAPASARVRDLPPTLGSAANPYICSSHEESLDVSPRIQNTTLYSGSFGSGRGGSSLNRWTSHNSSELERSTARVCRGTV